MEGSKCVMEYRNVAGENEITRMGCAPRGVADIKKVDCRSLDRHNYATSCYCTRSHCTMRVPKAYQSMEESGLPILWGIRQLKAHMEALIRANHHEGNRRKK